MDVDEEKITSMEVDEEKMPVTPRREPKRRVINTVKNRQVQGIYGKKYGTNDGHRVVKARVDLDKGFSRRQEANKATAQQKKSQNLKLRRTMLLGVGGTKKLTKKRRKTRRKKTSLPKSKKKTKKVKKKRRNKTKIKKGGNKKKHKKKIKKKRNKKNKKKKQLFEMSIKELKEYVKNKK